MVTEREGRNIENLENMGISKFTYYMATFTSLVILQIILSILITLGLKFFILFYCDFALFFLTYFSFAVYFCALGMFLSTFFLTTNKAIISGIVILILINTPYYMKAKIK